MVESFQVFDQNNSQNLQPVQVNLHTKHSNSSIFNITTSDCYEGAVSTPTPPQNSGQLNMGKELLIWPIRSGKIVTK